MQGLGKPADGAADSYAWIPTTSSSGASPAAGGRRQAAGGGRWQVAAGGRWQVAAGGLTAPSFGYGATARASRVRADLAPFGPRWCLVAVIVATVRIARARQEVDQHQTLGREVRLDREVEACRHELQAARVRLVERREHRQPSVRAVKPSRIALPLRALGMMRP